MQQPFKRLNAAGRAGLQACLISVTSMFVYYICIVTAKSDLTAVVCLQVMLMEVCDRIREEVGVSYPEDGVVQKLVTSLPSLT